MRALPSHTTKLFFGGAEGREGGEGDSPHPHLPPSEPISERSYFCHFCPRHQGLKKKEGRESPKRPGGFYWSGMGREGQYSQTCPSMVFLFGEVKAYLSGSDRSAIRQMRPYYPTDVAFKIGSQIVRKKVAIGKTLLIFEIFGLFTAFL